MQNSIIDSIEKQQEKKRPNFHVGDTVTVHVRLKEGDKERVQPFKGVVLVKSPKSGRGPQATFTVRKISDGIGVERVFSLHSPAIEKIKIETSAEVRKSRLFYLRSLRGKKARLKETERFAEMVLPEVPKEEPVVEAAVSEEVAAKAPEKAAPAEKAEKAEKKQEAKGEKKADKAAPPAEAKKVEAKAEEKAAPKAEAKADKKPEDKKK